MMMWILRMKTEILLECVVFWESLYPTFCWFAFCHFVLFCCIFFHSFFFSFLFFAPPSSTHCHLYCLWFSVKFPLMNLLLNCLSKIYCSEIVHTTSFVSEWIVHRYKTSFMKIENDREMWGGLDVNFDLNAGLKEKSFDLRPCRRLIFLPPFQSTPTWFSEFLSVQKQSRKSEGHRTSPEKREQTFFKKTPSTLQNKVARRMALRITDL